MNKLESIIKYVITTVLSGHSSTNYSRYQGNQLIFEPDDEEEYFHGVPLSRLDALANEVQRNAYCTIDQWECLVFHHMSKRGHKPEKPQMYIDEETGRLINTGGHYPNEIWSTADEFAKRANERFSFSR